MEHVARHCPSLIFLSMVELTKVRDETFGELGRRCLHMRHLDASSDINVLETSHRTRIPKLGSDGVRKVRLMAHLRTPLRVYETVHVSVHPACAAPRSN